MEEWMKPTKRWLVVLLVLCLFGFTWRAVQAASSHLAGRPSTAGESAGLYALQGQETPAPTDEPLTPTPTLTLVVEDGPSSGNWALFGLLLVGGMLLLILYGIGMATLLVKLRKKFDR